MIDLETAQQRILSSLPPLCRERLPLASVEKRFLAETIVAPVHLPLFDNSAMDGYAVRALDTERATPDAPVPLRLVGEAPAGRAEPMEVVPGSCIRVFTGAPLPGGADAVVMQEDACLDSGQPNTVRVMDRVRPWENLRLAGEDVGQGERLLEPGTLLTAAQIGLLGSLGITDVAVGRRPSIAVFSTGNELRTAGEALQPGEIYESNAGMLAALVRDLGCPVTILPKAKDDLAATKRLLQEALDEHDAVITSGGVSVGAYDFVKPAVVELGGTLDFWKVSIKPGKPFAFGRMGGKLIFGLPGNPVSAFVTFLMLVRPALLRWQGATEVALPSHPATLAESIHNPGDRRHFVRVTMDADGHVRSAGPQASHRLKSFCHANGLLDVPPKTMLATGEGVRVLRWS